MKKLVLVICVLCSLVAVTQAELFINGDFEAGDTWGQGGSGSGGSYPWPATLMPPTYQTTGGSDGGAWMELNTSAMVFAPTWTWGWGWSAIWSPDIAATTGEVLRLSGMAKHVDANYGSNLKAFVDYVDSASLRVDLNGDGLAESLGTGVAADWKLDRYMVSWVTGANWAAFSDTFTVPAVTGLAGLTVTISCEDKSWYPGGPGGDVVGIDELSLIPEPATMALLGLGGLLIRRKK